MAHGFLTPTPVTGESPISKYFEKKVDELIGKGVKKLEDVATKKFNQFKDALFAKKRDTTYRSGRGGVEVAGRYGIGENTAKGGGVLGGSKPKGLFAPVGGLTKSQENKIATVGKNGTDLDNKFFRKALPTSDPEKPGSGPRKGGSYVNMPGMSSGDGIVNKTNELFSKYAGFNQEEINQLIKERKITGRELRDLKRSVEAQAAAVNAPTITPDSGIDIVAAVNKNTEAIITLVDVTQSQTQNDTTLVNKQIQANETMMSRSRARAEENELEKGSDLSGFLKAERFKKLQKGQGGGGGGDDGLFDFLGLGLDALDLMGGGKRKRRGGRSGRRGGARRPPRLQAPRPRGGASPIPRTRPPAPKGGFRLPGMPKGLKGGGGALSLLFAGMEFSGRKSEGQSNLQAGVGTAASVAGGLAGAKGGAAAGAAIGAMFGGFGAVPGALIGGLIGGIGGSMLAGGAADMATGANNVGGFSSGGIITKPTLSMMGEGHKKEGVFPLEGKEGKKTFAMFGEGLIEAQDKAKDKFAKLQAAGLKFYFQNQDGFKFFGDILKNLFAPFLKPLEGLANLGGGLLNSLLGGPANAATSGLGADYLTDGSVEGNKRAILAAIKDAGYDDRAASNMLAQIQGESGFKMQSEGSYRNTSAARIRTVMGQRAAGYTDAQLNELKLDDKKFFDAMYGNDMGNAADEGFKYRGRGFIQLTGKNNYKKIGDIIGVDLVNNPDLMNDPAVAAKASVAFFKTVGANNQNMATMQGAYQAVYRGNPNATTLDAKDRERIASRGANAQRFYSQMQSGELTGSARQPAPGQGGKVVEYLTGDKTSSGYRADHDGGNYHDHIAFDSKETRDAAAEWLKKKGWKIGSMNDGRHADGSYHYSDQAFDIPFYPNQRIKGVTDDDAGETKLSSALRKDLAEGGFTGSGISPVPGANPPENPQQPLTAAQKAKMFQSAGMPALSASTLAGATPPGPVPATPAAANTGTPLMATSSQVASASMHGGSTGTIINNYYGGNGNQPMGVNPNGVTAGIGMDGTGTSVFQDLRIRSLG